ncbi:MAG: sigma-70 family RNA polymerase sigma factor [Acidimicrobiia bacterium]
MNGADLDVLLVAVADGDRDAFSQFYDLTSDLVFGIARRVAIDPDLAAEITQEVFLEVWRKAGSFDSQRGTARTWVAVMAKRRAIDVVRSTQSARDRDEAQVGTTSIPGDPVGETVADDDDRRRVAVALQELTDLQREALDLAFFGGLSHRQVAERLDLPLGTVKTRIRDGLARLASAMGTADG